MENISPAQVVIANNKFYSFDLRTCFEEFLRVRPNIEVIGNDFFIMLEDATRSLTKSIVNTYHNKALDDICEDIVKLTDKYAKIYFRVKRLNRGDEETILILFRSVLCDLVRKYNNKDSRLDELISHLYENIRKLITV